jgi:hypothetical protein
MTEQRILDFGRIDVLGARHDHVLHSVIDEHIVVFVHVGGVAGAHPAIADGVCGRPRLVPITLHDDG